MSGSLAVLEALKRAGKDLTREKVIAELNKLSGFDPGIQSAPLNFSASNHAGIQGGKMVVLSDGKPQLVAELKAE
jgi:branched-chain amino acid transport system substrate-binding protein